MYGRIERGYKVKDLPRLNAQEHDMCGSIQRVYLPTSSPIPLYISLINCLLKSSIPGDSREGAAKRKVARTHKRPVFEHAGQIAPSITLIL